MKNKIILSFALIVVGASSFVFWKMKKTENKFSETSELKNEHEENETQEFSQAAEWWNKVRANQVTHTINYADVLQAQEDAMTLEANQTRAISLDWTEMGPDNVGGRTRALLFDKNNPNHLFAGGVSGGLWESNNMGQSWERANGSHDWVNQNVSCIAQAYNGDIYVGTGEKFGFFTTSVVGGATGFPGHGIWRSADDGLTWTNVKVPQATNLSTSDALSFVTSMASGGAMHPTRVYATVNGGGSTSSLIYTDNGTDWSNCLVNTTSISSMGYDVEVASNGIVHCIGANKYYRSGSSGTNDFVLTTGTGLPSNTQVNRMGIAVSPTDPNYVYVIASYNGTGGELLKGVYKSTDGGTTFTQIAPTQSSNNSVNWSPVTQGGYALAIAVNPNDKNEVFIGGLDCYKYQLQSNGNYGWTKITRWTYPEWYSLYCHADIHYFAFHPTNPNIMFIGSDGGLSMTTNASDDQPYFGTRDKGFNVTQFYGFDVRPYSGYFVAGAQDNGNYLVDFTGNTPKSGQEIKGGDGGDVAVSVINSNAIFAEYVNGSVERSSNNGASFLGFFDTHIDGGTTPDGEPDEGAAFIAPLELWENPANGKSKFFLGTSSGVWMTTQGINFSVSPTWFKINKGHNTSGVVIALASTPDGNTIFAGTESGNLYRIDGLDTTYAYDTTGNFNPDNIGITTTLIQSWSGRYITGITIDKNNSDHVIVTLGNYGNTGYVYESVDAMNAANFSSITGNLPKMPVYCSVVDPIDDNKIVIGTELGIYATENGGSTWSSQNNGIAPVVVTKLKQVPVGNNENVIYACTYGNGVWKTESMAFLSDNTISKPANQLLNIYPNPASSKIEFSTSIVWGTSPVTATIFDASGKMIKQVNFGKQVMGVHSFSIDVSEIENGVYLIYVQNGSKVQTAKMVISR